MSNRGKEKEAVEDVESLVQRRVKEKKELIEAQGALSNVLKIFQEAQVSNLNLEEVKRIVCAHLTELTLF